MFTQQNTHGYSDAELAEINAEGEKRIPELMEMYGMDREEAELYFADEVACRDA